MIEVLMRDCPRSSSAWRAILMLLGTVWLCAGPSHLLAQPQQAVPRADSCGRADPSYIRVANESGGQPMFLKPSEVGRVGHFIREQTGNNRETLLWATGTIDRGRQFPVPIDSTVERVTFSLSVDGEGGRLTIVRPSGVPVRSG